LSNTPTKYITHWLSQKLGLTLREEHKLRMFENRVLRRIFGPKREEATEGRRKLHNEELHNLYSSPNIIRVFRIRRMKLEGHVARMSVMRNAYKYLVGKPEGKRTLGKPGHTWDDNIKMDLKEIWCELGSSGLGHAPMASS
jgi:hypothetical protein